MRLRILTFLLVAAAPALAQPVSHDETVIVTGRRADLTGIATSANQGSISAEDLAQRPPAATR